MKLAVVEEIPEECNVYIESAVPEFTKELAAYRDWVMAGADPVGTQCMALMTPDRQRCACGWAGCCGVSVSVCQLPTMHIPASPLDQNVDVPLENW